MAALSLSWLLNRSRIARTVIIALLLCPVFACANDRFVPDEIIVRMRPNRGAALASLNAQSGGKVKKHIRRIGYQTIKLPKGSDVDAVIARYRKNPAVEYVGRNHVITLCTDPIEPNDFLFRYGMEDPLGLNGAFVPQWGLYNDGYNNGWGGEPGADINARMAWTITTGSPDVVIAIIDSGLDYYHPDMIGKMWINPGEDGPNGILRNNHIDDDGNGYIDDWRGWNVVDGDNDPMDTNLISHGTFVSGVAAANTNNEIGLAGVAWNCPILPVRIIGDWIEGTEDDAAEGIVYAADMGAKVINMSFTALNTPAMEAAIDYAWEKGSLCVCASGNSGSLVTTYPASYSKALAVGGSDEYDQRWVEALFGSGGANYGSYLDVVAPANQIIGPSSLWDFQGYDITSGTSAAAPMVSGVAALIWSQNPGWTNAQVYHRIVTTADDIGTAGWDIETGWGRVNAYRALTDPISSAASGVGAVKSMSTSYLSEHPVLLTGKVLSTASGEIPGRMYIQEPDRSSGILLSFSGVAAKGFTDGDRVDVFGRVGLVSGECAFIEPLITKSGTGSTPKPLAVTNRALGGGAYGMQSAVVNRYSLPQEMGSGLNNIGMLVTTTGYVTAVGLDWFYMDDGTGLDDGTSYRGVFVDTSRGEGSLQRPGLGQYAVITGISSCDKPTGSSVLRRVLRPRKQDDIQALW